MSDVVRGDDGVRRCRWGASTPDYIPYHDNEWGRPLVDDTRLYEKLCLEGFQSGLSWITILRKRENFRRAFAGFEPARVARFGVRDVNRLLGDAGIVRHRGKIEAAIANARALVEVDAQHGSLAVLCWSFAPPERPGAAVVRRRSDPPRHNRSTGDFRGSTTSSCSAGNTIAENTATRHSDRSRKPPD